MSELKDSANAGYARNTDRRGEKRRLHMANTPAANGLNQLLRRILEKSGLFVEEIWQIFDWQL